MANYVDNLITNILAGKNTLSGELRALESQVKRVQNATNQIGVILDKDLSKAMGRGTSLASVYKDVEIEMLNIDRMMAKGFGGPAKGPNFDQLFAGLTEDTNKLSRIQSFGNTLGMLQRQGIDVNTQMKDMRNLISGNTQWMQVFNRAIGDGIQKQKELDQQFNMNSLSWLFGGMALRQIGLSIMRFVIPSMDQLNKLGTEGAKKVIGMSAAFEFLKISMFETFSQTPLFKTMIEFFTDLFIKVSEFVQEHPNVTAMVAAIGGIATALGTAAMGTGIIMQLEHLMTLLADDSKLMKGINKFVGSDLFKKSAGVIEIGWSIKNIIEDINDSEFDIVDNIVNAAMLTTGLALLGVVSGGTLILAGAIIFSLITTIEAIIDPAGFGSSLVRLANHAANYVEGWMDIYAWIGKSIKSIFTEFKVPEFDVFDGWFGSFSRGAVKEMDKLKSEGKLSDTLSAVRENLLFDPDMSYGATGGLGEPFEQMSQAAQESTGYIDALDKATGNLGKSMVTHIGSDESEVSGKTMFSKLSEEIDASNTKFVELSSSIDNWQPKDKHVYIYYHHLGRSERDDGMSGSDYVNGMGAD